MPPEGATDKSSAKAEFSQRSDGTIEVITRLGHFVIVHSLNHAVCECRQRLHHSCLVWLE